MIVKVISVSKVYEGHGNKPHIINAVENVSIDINEGSYTLIFGPTGSGKTTLLSLIAGIIYPTDGEIVFHNIHLSSSNDSKISLFRERYIGYIPQNTLFIKELTVLENILSPNSFLKRRMRKLKSYAFELLERLKLSEKAQARPFELSGGEVKKAMVIRALVKKPMFILADEPCSELDKESTKEVINLFNEEHERGSAVIIASHNPMQFKKRVDLYTMVRGQIIEYKKGGKN